MDLYAVGAVSRAGEKYSVLFCEYTGSSTEETLIDAFLNGLEIELDRKSIYCLAVRYENDTVSNMVGIYYHKNGVSCMVYDKPYEYLTDYIAEIFSEELKKITKALEGVQEDDAKTN